MGGCNAPYTPADRWFSHRERLPHVRFLFLFFKTFDGSQAEGRRGSRGLLSVTVGAASSGAESLTSAARPVLADLKAVSAEAEGAVPCHDAAVAAAQLVAG